MNKKFGASPVILTFVSNYLPGYKSGGPVRSIANMVEALGGEFEFRIVTHDRDLLDNQPYEDININRWNHVGKAIVYYVSPDMKRIALWKKIILDTPHDVLYVNGLFDLEFSILPLVVRWFNKTSKVPIVVAPRGCLSPGALSIKSWKKRPYLFLTKMLGLYKDAVFQASSVEEEKLIRKELGKSCQCVVAINVPARIQQSVPQLRQKDADAPLRILFLSRISKNKNLDFALKVLLQCQIKITFDIWGTMEDKEYWQICEKIIDSMPKNISVNYRGMADHEQVPLIMSGYDLFFFPTRGENYGHVIAEAVSAGTPVLISDQTPWLELKEQGVGWNLPLESNKDAFVAAIESTAKKVQENRREWRNHVYQYAVKKLNDPAIIEANRHLFFQSISSYGK